MIEPENSNPSKTLVHIQAQLKAKKDLFNKFGKYYYRSAESILEALKPLLLQFNAQLTINEEIITGFDYPIIKTTCTLMTSNALAGVDVNKKGMDYAQAFGTSESYSCKRALGNLFLLDDTKDSDSKVERASLYMQLWQEMGYKYQPTISEH